MDTNRSVLLIYLPVSKNVGETEVLVIRERMEIEKVANVDVLQTEGIRFAVWLLRRARRLVIDLLSDIASVSIRRASIHTSAGAIFGAIPLPLFVEPRT